MDPDDTTANVTKDANPITPQPNRRERRKAKAMERKFKRTITNIEKRFRAEVPYWVCRGVK